MGDDRILVRAPLAEHFLPTVQADVDRDAFRYPTDRIIPILRAERSDDAGVLGAVTLVMQAAEAPGACPVGPARAGATS